MTNSSSMKDSVTEKIGHYQRSIERSQNDPKKILNYLKKLQEMNVTLEHLQLTGIGITLNKMRKSEGELGIVIRALVLKWKEMVSKHADDNVKADGNDVIKPKDAMEYKSENTGNLKIKLKLVNNTTDKKTSERESKSYSRNNGKSHSSTEHKRRRDDDHSTTSLSKKLKFDPKSSSSKIDEVKIMKHEKMSSKSLVKPAKSDRKIGKENQKSNSNSSSNRDEKKISKGENKTSKPVFKPAMVIDNSMGTSFADALGTLASMPTHSKAKTLSSTIAPSKVVQSKVLPSKIAPSANAPLKFVPSANAPSKIVPSANAPLKIAPSANAPSKIVPLANAPLKFVPSANAPSKIAPSANAPSKIVPSVNAPLKFVPSANAPLKFVPSANAPSKIAPSANAPSRIVPSVNAPLKFVPLANAPSKIIPSANAASKIVPSANAASKIVPSSNVKSKIPPSTNAPSTSGKSSTKSSMVTPSFSHTNKKPTEFSKPSIISKTPTPSLLLEKPKLPSLGDLSIDFPSLDNNCKPSPVMNFTTSTPIVKMSEADSLCASTTSKTQRTKIYSGIKSGTLMTAPTLNALCVRVVQKHIDDIEYTGGIPFEFLRPILERATPKQLNQIENYNPYLSDDSDYLWQQHCQRKFKASNLQDMETWRETYNRYMADEENRLNNLTRNIRASQSIALPVRQTQMAYVDSMVKPPRDVIKTQNQFGTHKNVTATPAARTAALKNVASNMNKVGDKRAKTTAQAMTSQGVRDTNEVKQPSKSTYKPKKAPLMAKTIRFMKSRFN